MGKKAKMKDYLLPNFERKDEMRKKEVFWETEFSVFFVVQEQRNYGALKLYWTGKKMRLLLDEHCCCL